MGQIADAVGIDHHFISMQTYDDQITFDLVAQASTMLDVPADELLRQFGSYWIRFTAAEGYGHLIPLFGDSLESFLSNLGNDLHARVSLTMPELQPPEFRTEQTQEGTWHVEYRSHRHGLRAMVLGLLEGLAERFNESVVVTHLSSAEDNGTVVELFEIEIQD